MTAEQLKNSIIEELAKVRVADRFVLTRFRSSLPKQQAVNQLTTAEIAMNHGNDKRDSSAIDKLYGSELTTINSIVRQLRETGKTYGFPYWQAGSLNTGVNMMPSTAYGAFFDRVQALNAALSQEVNRIADNWDDLLIRRSNALKGLFRPEQYPTAEEFRKSVQAEYRILPVPDGNSLQRMVDDLTGDAAEAFAKNVQATDEEQRKALAESLLKQLQKFIAECRNVENVLSKDKPRIFTTLFDELRGMVAGLTGAGFPSIASIAESMQEIVADDPKNLCGTDTARLEVADTAKQAADEAELVARQLASMI